MPFLRVLYTCHQCGLEDRPVEIPERGPDEDVAAWFTEVLAGAISVDHSLVSPGCRAQKMDSVKVPITGVNRVDDVPRN
jgi:hypothetical protein